MKSRFILASVVLLLTAVVACHRIKRYPMQGEVVAKDITTGEITVKHGDIPGFMMAMTMPYRVKNPALVQELQPGDKIAAEVVVGSDRSDYRLEDIRITDESARGQARPATGTRMLMPGARVPDVALINQDGRTIHLSDFSGKALLVTFIYTRCPMPDFCPRLSSQFALIHEELKKTPGDYSKTHLLTISFDPKYDTPTVLRKYGLSYLNGDEKGFAHWDFASAQPADLHRLAEDFGLQYEEKDDQITHTMNIVLIAANGTMSQFWSTNWTWTELMESMTQAARATAPDNKAVSQ
jgi:protein SCO1/2